jgi:PAS domain S-box-containing protein
LWEDGELSLCRDGVRTVNGIPTAVLSIRPAAEQLTPASLDRLAHEFDLKDDLESAWALRPLELLSEGGRALLVLEDPGGEPLSALLGAPMELGRALRLAIGIVTALGKAHQHGLVHKDIKPANIFVSAKEVRLTGFGIASRLQRERQAPEPPETIAGTLAYMAPEQTGRMNRSIDARSDLYAFGVTLYQMLTGSLPFAADDPMEWVHCHIARQPASPAERSPAVPEAVSAVVMKLLAKTAEERYQTAGGLEHDLRRCLSQWEAGCRIDPFAVGERDIPDRLLLPEKLYGREREVATLIAAFDRIVASGAPELVLVSGYSGVGKSSVVNELHKVLVPPRGLFSSGKFDQYKRDIPYATLAQAFESLVRPLLGKSDTELNAWRDALLEALGPNGQLIVDIVPELKLILGSQPPVPELPPQEAQRRFQLVFRRFISVFARPEHPLALFLDDLQWLDAATLDLLEDLLTRSDLQHLMLIGAYRDNEVTPIHPLMRSLDAIRRAGGVVQQIVLAPLVEGDLKRLIADALHCAPEHAASLADLVHSKTAGNPLFAIQFLTALAEEGLLAFDSDQGAWVWDLKRIHAKGYTDNVVDLMLGMLRRLPASTQRALQQLACLGNIAPISTLAIVHGTSREALHATLWEAVRAGLVLRVEGAFRFLHDRVQEAAYALIPADKRAAEHLRIGRLLVAAMPEQEIVEKIFDLVNQFNLALSLISDWDEKQHVAELNLFAGKRAKEATAYASALTYLITGEALLAGGEVGPTRSRLAFNLAFTRAECEYLTGQFSDSERRLAMLAASDAPLTDLAAVACLRQDLYTTLDRSDRAVEVCLEYLGHLGIEWSPHPPKDEVWREYEIMWAHLEGRTIGSLVDLPAMNEVECRATIDVLTATVAPATLTDENLLCLVIARMANLSLQHGNTDASCFAYVYLGMLLGPYFGNYAAAFRFGKLAIELVEKPGLDRFRARVYMCFGSFVNPWAKHIRAGQRLLRASFDIANNIGDLTWASYSCNNLITNLLACGESLAEVQRQAEARLEFVRKARFGLIADMIVGQLGLVRSLRGLTQEFGAFDDSSFDEQRFVVRVEADPALAFPAGSYWIRKLQAVYVAGDFRSAIEAAAKAERHLWTFPSFFEVAEYHFYGGLAHAACCHSADGADLVRHRASLTQHRDRLAQWAANCPENFNDRLFLVDAEIARLSGRELEAMPLYERAIRSARDSGFVHTEALAYERASDFYRAHGVEQVANLYLRNARDVYLRWGAAGKVRQLDKSYPHHLHDVPVPGATGTIAVPVEQLDLATVIKVLQAVSGEIVHEKLLGTLMHAAMAQAGAERGLLILSNGAEHRIATEAATCRDAITVQPRNEPATAHLLPESVLHYVLRAKESVILDDATAENPFANDPYVRQHHVRSVVCLPLLNQCELIGVLYLENNLAARVFASDRIAVLKLLASQAAIALENTRLYGKLELLYRDVAEREAKIRRLVEANIIGIFMWQLEGESPETTDAVYSEANDAFLSMVGYDRDDFASGRVRRSTLTPPEWRERTGQAQAELVRSGTIQPYEKEYLRKDGTRVPVLVGAAAFEGRKQGVSFILDLTERKRAEAEMQESERRCREAQIALEHANRVSTLGQLVASITHEIKQPVAASAVNAQAGLRWLSAQPPQLEEVRLTFDRIIKDATRASEVANRIRGLIKNAPPRKEPLQINEAIGEVIALTRAEARKSSVSSRTQLAEDLPMVEGDRIQLQQVMLNLVLNAIEAMSAVDEGSRDLIISSGHDVSGGVLVSVRDSGPGVAAENKERLFEPFYPTKADGMGMGLSICRSIVDEHGGRLWVTANMPHGAVFQFTVPALALPNGASLTQSNQIDDEFSP